MAVLQKLKGATKDKQTISPDGVKINSERIHGVKLIEKRNIVTRSGVTTELLSTNWEGVEPPRHVIQVMLRANAISAWHGHEEQVDTIFVTQGTIKAALYDNRKDSPTNGVVNNFNLSFLSPTFLLIPNGVWHGFQNLDNQESRFLNMFNNPYIHNDPDEWRLPFDTPEIPYRFK